MCCFCGGVGTQTAATTTTHLARAVRDEGLVAVRGARAASGGEQLLLRWSTMGEWEEIG